METSLLPPPEQTWRVHRAAQVITRIARLEHVPVSHVLIKSLGNAFRQGINHANPSSRITQVWNNPHLESFEWLEWARYWSDALVKDPVIESGDWSRTVFVAGFLASGSSTVARFIYDSLGVPPPRTELVSFRQPHLPALVDGSKSLRDFLLESVVGVSVNPRLRHQAWLAHAVQTGYQEQILPHCVMAPHADSEKVSLARLAHAFLAPKNQLLVLDNALHREHTRDAHHYVGSKWIVVVRDLPSHYAQIRFRGTYSGWSIAQFCSFMESSIQATQANLHSHQVHWIHSSHFLRDATLRQSLMNKISPQMVVSAAPQRVFGAKAEGEDLGVSLSRGEKIALQKAEARIYESIDFAV